MEEIKSEHGKRQEKKQGAQNKKSVKRKNMDDTVNKTKNKGKKNKKQKTIVDEDSDTLEEPKFDVSSDELPDIDEQIEKEIVEEHFVTGVVNRKEKNDEIVKHCDDNIATEVSDMEEAAEEDTTDIQSSTYGAIRRSSRRKNHQLVFMKNSVNLLSTNQLLTKR
ncbi:hypothetical protein JTB14_028563 [Gonioctena quinquepunctata]|nr:hypothetical protein JTB14_028563 [Gonioctena quinquepunctata]